MIGRGRSNQMINKILGAHCDIDGGVIMLKVKISLDLHKTLFNVYNCEIQHRL